MNKRSDLWGGECHKQDNRHMDFIDEIRDHWKMYTQDKRETVIV